MFRIMTASSLVAWLLLSTASPAARSLEFVLAGAHCAAAIESELDRWRAVRAGALVDPPGPAGSRSARIPTETIGVWLRVTVDASGTTLLERITGVAAHASGFGSACEVLPEVSTHFPPPSREMFADSTLAELLATRRRGVILMWSPHMPLSMDQYGELVAAATPLGLEIVAVLDPLADPDYARQMAATSRIPPSALRRAASIELAFRGMTTHAPSMLIFSDGNLVGPVLFGYRPRDIARTAILETIADPPAIYRKER